MAKVVHGSDDTGIKGYEYSVTPDRAVYPECPYFVKESVVDGYCHHENRNYLYCSIHHRSDVDHVCPFGSE
jgi:hypothetical protein